MLHGILQMTYYTQIVNLPFDLFSSYQGSTTNQLYLYEDWVTAEKGLCKQDAISENQQLGFLELVSDTFLLIFFIFLISKHQVVNFHCFSLICAGEGK